MTKSCVSITCDVLCICVSLTAIYWSAVNIFGQASLDKSTASSGSGFHLLSCPKLFEENGSELNFKNKYGNIQLDSESTEKLMNKLKDSLSHAHVLHSGRDNKKGLRTYRGIEAAVKEKTGGAEIDINIPTKVDNKHLCGILKEIVDEQIEKDRVMPKDEGDQHVTLSIMKLDSEEDDSLFSVGARYVRRAPLVQSLIHMANLDEGIGEIIEKAKQIDLVGALRLSANVA
jgi:hypothetical protein